MRPLRSQFELVLVIALLLGLPATAAAQSSAFQALSGQQAAAFTVPGDMQLVKTFDLPAYGLTYERYQQFFGDQEAGVLGGQITLYRDGAGNVTTVIGAHYDNIAPSNAIGLTAAAVRGLADRDIGPDGERTVDLMINPTTGRYFYRVETRRMDTRWFHWIDAANGQLLNRYDGITTNDGTGVKGDTKDMNGPNDASIADDLTTFHGAAGHGASGPHYDLFSTDNRQQTYDYLNRDPFIYFVTDDDNHWNLVTSNRQSPGQPALVDAQYYANVTDDYFQQLGLNWTTDCGYTAMQSVAHYNKNYNNAFWNGTYTIYGDGDGNVFRELSGGLDVVAHENTHGVTECTSNLIYQDESGALNESFSDMLGNSAEFYAEANNLDEGFLADWLIGEDVYLTVDTAPGFRNMADPEEDGDPDHYSERQVGGSDNGGVHTNSGISNHAFYLLVNGGLNASCASEGDHNSAHCTGGIGDASPVVGIGVADAEQIFFSAFMGLPSNATMAEARAATEAAATTLFGDPSQQLQSTTDAWVAVGVGPGGPTDDPPTVSLTSPVNGATVSGTIDVAADASDDNGVTQVEFFVDGASIGVDTTAPYTASWDTTAVADGAHTVTAAATDTIGQTASDSVDVTVDNGAPPGGDVTVTGIDPNSMQAGISLDDVTITGSGFAVGASVTFENGSGPAPEASNIVVVNANTITATITAKSGGPPRNRVWDVGVTNSDGSSGVLAGGFTVTP